MSHGIFQLEPNVNNLSQLSAVVLPAMQNLVGGVLPGAGLSVAADGTLSVTGGGSGGAVSSVFGRTGAVVAASGDYTAAQITNAVSTAGSYSDPQWITGLSWSKILSAPAFFADPTTTKGDLIVHGSTTTRLPIGTDGQALTADSTQTLGVRWATVSSGGGAVTSVFGRTGAVIAVSGDYTAAEVTNAVDQTASYANPAWISSLAYSKITGAPAAYSLPPATATVLGGVKIGANITVQADGTISVAAPVAAPVASVFGRTGTVVAASGDYSAAEVTNAVDSTQTYANPAWISSLAYSKITGAPAGYVLPAATASVLGGVKIGANITVQADGTISVAAAGTGTVTSVGLAMPTEWTVTGSPVTSSGTLTVAKATQAANLVYAGPASGSAAAPAFRALAAADLPAGTGTVTSVAMTMPSDFTVGGSPVTTSGTLAVTRATQAKNLVLAGPASGSNAVPTYRALVAADLPSGLGTGTVTSVAMTMPAEFSVAGSPVTTSGTLAVTKATQTANLIYAGPASGVAAAPTFRALVAADLPSGIGTGTVTSVALTMPAEFTVGGTPITSSGTLAVTKATQAANLVYAGPASGSAAAPAFRALAAADFSSSVIGGFQTPWLQNINGAGYSLTNVSQIGIGTSSPQFLLNIAGGSLGATQGNVVNLLNLYNTNSNANYFQIWQFRNAGGSDWTTATTRIMNFTDSNAQAYIDFNPPGGTWGMAFGLGSGEKIRISNNNCVGIGTTSPNKTLSVNGDIAIPAGSRLYLQSDTDPNHYIYDNGSDVMIFGEWNGSFNFYDTNAGFLTANIDGHNFGLNNGSYYSHGGGAGLYVDDRTSTSYNWGFYATGGSARILSSQYGGDQYWFAPNFFTFGNAGGPNAADIQTYMNGNWGVTNISSNTFWTGSGFNLRNGGYPGIIAGGAVLNNGTGDASWGVTYVPIGGGARQLFAAQMYQNYCYTTLSAGSGANIDAQVVQGGQWYTYAPNNTQLYFRMRGADGVFRQAVLNLS